MSKENNGKPKDEDPIDGADFTELKKYMATQMMGPFNNKKCNIVYKIIRDAIDKSKTEFYRCDRCAFPTCEGCSFISKEAL